MAGLSATLTFLLLSWILLLSGDKVAASTFKQNWLAPEGDLPMLEIKKDCSNSGISDLEIYALAEDVDLSACAFINLYFTHLKEEIKDCYNNPMCTRVPWDRSAVLAMCDEVNARIPEGRLQLQVTLNCEIPKNLTLYNLTNTNKLNAGRPLCPNGENQKISHIFSITPCRKPMIVGEAAWTPLYRLAKDMESCGKSCAPIDVTDYSMEKPDCTNLQLGVAALGVYWTCDSGVVLPSPSPNGSTKTVAKPGSLTKEELEELETKYLTPLIVMSVLFALCLLLLVGVVLCFCRYYKRKNTFKVAQPFDDAPPSRQALYELASTSSDRGCHSRQGSGRSSAISERYKTVEKTNKLNEQQEEQYAMPMLPQQQEGLYYNQKEADQDDEAYEDIDALKMYQTLEEKQMGRGVSSKSYVSMNKYKKPQRMESEKYSDGYLLPSALRNTDT